MGETITQNGCRRYKSKRRWMVVKTPTLTSNDPKEQLKRILVKSSCDHIAHSKLCLHLSVKDLEAIIVG